MHYQVLFDISCNIVICIFVASISEGNLNSLFQTKINTVMWLTFQTTETFYYAIMGLCSPD